MEPLERDAVRRQLEPGRSAHALPAAPNLTSQVNSVFLQLPSLHQAGRRVLPGTGQGTGQADAGSCAPLRGLSGQGTVTAVTA